MRGWFSFICYKKGNQFFRMVLHQSFYYPFPESPIVNCDIPGLRIQPALLFAKDGELAEETTVFAGYQILHPVQNDNAGPRSSFALKSRFLTF